MVATEGTALQLGALNHFVDAVLQSRDKSLQKLLDYIRMGDKAPAPAGIDAELEKWWVETRPRLYATTTSSVEQQLTNFMREHRGSPILRNLKADSWGGKRDKGKQFDFFEELHDGGKVLLIDTDHLKNGAVGAALMGRLFIALIENISARRQRAPKPIWVYIDEASDYLSKNDPSFVQIYTKAAGAKVGMTVAHQYTGQLDPRIEEALNNAEIHSLCEQRGTVQLNVEERPLTLPIKELEFTREPQMLPEEYKQMRELLVFHYAYKTAPTLVEQDLPLTQKF